MRLANSSFSGRCSIPNYYASNMTQIKTYFMVDYLKIGIFGFGISSNLVDKKIIDANDFNIITELTKNYVANVK